MFTFPKEVKLVLRKAYRKVLHWREKARSNSNVNFSSFLSRVLFLLSNWQENLQTCSFFDF